MRHDQLQHRFVEFIPEQLEESILYISLEYMTVTHLCCCGCGHEVSVTLSPTDWRLICDGRTVSIEPSIGSWRLPSNRTTSSLRIASCGLGNGPNTRFKWADSTTQSESVSMALPI
jgi:hypothetical protein